MESRSPARLPVAASSAADGQGDRKQRRAMRIDRARALAEAPAAHQDTQSFIVETAFCLSPSASVVTNRRDHPTSAVTKKAFPAIRADASLELG